ncbi:beta-1,4-xylosidase with transcriptional regulator of AraC/XylS family [Treponema primitia ZAS-2]|uniref:Beta-1,4-xylosidase with transcriptional regulator of AraC/XylS family n=1 Tax=Treponema primitia (strain ATCC BAA-887 / DSM 12427 / ZAS-2) TaxID=545694 RepID=F5YQV8_TREPZ|nr:helix-turn-helix domain-containing protein [Treponema primitia]AEF86905.1 beta-1,4-xylosidase with transcriptional regulator of AraC/XylS family [Treponema primitia ZAS-2]
MDTNYEIVHYKQGLSVHILIHGGSRFRLHWHTEIEIILVLKGHIQLTVGGQRYELVQDDLFFINANEIHSTAGSEDTIVAVLQIDPAFCVKHYPALENCYILWPREMLRNYAGENQKEEIANFLSRLRYLFASILEEYRKNENGYQLVIEGLLNTLMALIIRSVPSKNQLIAPDDKRNKEYGRIHSLLKYIQKNYAERITLNTLADRAGLSVYYFSHFFKDNVGISFLEYLNQIRLYNATNMLSQKEMLISDIALGCGFTSVKAFNKVFKDFHGITPGEYRHQQVSFAPFENSDSYAYMNFDSLQVLSQLQEYLAVPSPSAALSSVELILENNIIVDAGKAVEGELFPNWEDLGSVGRAYDCLRSDLQNQIREAAKELGIRHLRFHGIFGEEMRVVNRDKEGKIQFCWTYIDRVFDFLTETGVCPMVDLTFMPNAFKSGEKTIFRYRGNISLPRDLSEWAALITAFANHCIDRYGREEVRRWYFEIWNEPDFLCVSSQEEYFAFYKATAEAFLRADHALKIAGPSIIQPMPGYDKWLDTFVEFLNANNLPLDCFTFHIYGESNWNSTNHRRHALSRIGDRNHFTDCVTTYTEKIARLNKRVNKIFITEFNISAEHGNYLLDTMFAACHLLYNYLCNHDRLNGIAFWTLSDIFEEDEILIPAFGGGFGLVTAEGIRKPSWWALWFLHHVRGAILARGDEYVITKKDDGIAILIFRYVYYDQFFTEGDHSLLSFTTRYEVFEKKSPALFAFTVQGLSGKYTAREYTLDRTHGSAFDIFADMGFPQELSSYDTEYLRSMAHPHTTVKSISLTGSFTTQVIVPPQGIKMIILKKTVE